MPDNKKKKGPLDDKRIASDEYSYWTKRFKVSSPKLRGAVQAVGTSVAAVEKYLQGKKKK